MARINHKQRRGLSSVVGAVFMVLVMLGALNAILLTMRQQNTVTQAVIDKSSSSLNKLNEDIAISDMRVSGGKLNMTVTNTGGAAATLKSIYVINETSKQQYRYDLNLPIDGRNSGKNIGQSLPLTIKSDTNYSVKVVTESGNTAASKISSLSSVALPMQLYVIPPTVTPGENVTLLFTVANNITDSNLAWPVTPTLQYSCSGCTLTSYVAPPSSSTLIGKGSTALFKWVYKVSGSDRTTVTFNASLTNAKQGNFVTEKALVKLVESAQTSFSSEIIISSTLVQKPEIFLMIPSPYGDSGNQGLWGVIVANPTNVTMDVSRVVFNLYTSKPSSNQQMIKDTLCGGSDKTALYPTTTSEWTCPHDNMLEWKNVGSPQQISGFSAKSFMLKIRPGDLNNGDESAFMISVAVFTNMGQFTKTGYSSGMSSTALSLGSVYLTNTTNTSNTLLTKNTFGNINGFVSEATVKVNVTIADLDTDSATKIKSGAKLIVNVPRGFTNVVPTPNAAFSSINKYSFSDSSTQIVATLANDLGDTAGGVSEAQVLSFTATAPTTNSTRVYIMHSLIDGETSTNFSAGAVSELALQILCKGYPTCSG